MCPAQISNILNQLRQFDRRYQQSEINIAIHISRLQALLASKHLPDWEERYPYIVFSLGEWDKNKRQIEDTLLAEAQIEIQRLQQQYRQQLCSERAKS